MLRRSIVSVFSLFLVALMTLAPAATASAADKSTTSFPLSATSDTQGTFTGTLRIVSFGVQEGQLVASGLVSGTLVDENGIITSIARTVTLPMMSFKASCEILHLELGPLDLDLLGLTVHLDKVVLDITAVPGAGNLLGNLLCAVANLLNNGGPLSQIANLLNQILALLG